MKKIILLLLVFVSFNAYAQQQSVTLHLPGMNCAACPLTVKMALNRVEGVNNAKVDFQTKQALVNYDDTKVTVNELIKATTNAGYPSTVIHPDQIR